MIFASLVTIAFQQKEQQEKQQTMGRKESCQEIAGLELEANGGTLANEATPLTSGSH
jgi:hypothetical protein